MSELIYQVKELWKKLVSSSVDARYKAIKQINGVLAYLLRYVILIAIGYIILYPLLFMISSAFRTRESFWDPSSVWISKEFTLSNFEVAFRVMKYLRSLWNTISYELVAGLIQIISCAVVAYGLARFEFKEKKILTFLLFVTIMVPAQMMIIPIVTTYNHLDVVGILGLVNNLTGVDLRPNILNTHFTFFLPALFAVGIKSGIIIYIYMQFFKGLPKELEEAAWIDGAGPVKTFIRIALPSSGVVIMTVSIFSVIWHWNDYYLASMYLYSQNFTLAVMLYDIDSLLVGERVSMSAGNAESIAIVMAACLIFILPVLVMYMFLQKNFIKSIDRVGITG